MVSDGEHILGYRMSEHKQPQLRDSYKGLNVPGPVGTTQVKCNKRWAHQAGGPPALCL